MMRDDKSAAIVGKAAADALVNELLRPMMIEIIAGSGLGRSLLRKMPGTDRMGAIHDPGRPHTKE